MLRKCKNNFLITGKHETEAEIQRSSGNKLVDPPFVWCDSAWALPLAVVSARADLKGHGMVVVRFCRFA